jgi:hypothetical protein
MTTRRRKSLKQPDQNVIQTMEEDFSAPSEEISEPAPEPFPAVEELTLPVPEPVQRKVKATPPLEPKQPKKHPRNIPRFSRGVY